MKTFLRTSVVIASILGLLASCHSMGNHKTCGAECNSQKNQAKVEEPKTNVQPQEKKVKKAKKAKKAPAAKPAEAATPSAIVKEPKAN